MLLAELQIGNRCSTLADCTWRRTAICRAGSKAVAIDRELGGGTALGIMQQPPYNVNPGFRPALALPPGVQQVKTLERIYRRLRAPLDALCTLSRLPEIWEPFGGQPACPKP
jgi:hypothetical protein